MKEKAPDTEESLKASLADVERRMAQAESNLQLMYITPEAAKETMAKLSGEKTSILEKLEAFK